MSRDDLRGPWYEWPLQPLELIRGLEARRVRYVVIGGFAGITRGSPLPTYDLDIVPAADARNRSRLRSALEDLDAELVLETRVAAITTESAQRAIEERDALQAKTPFGWLDVHFHPSGTQGYADLRRHSTRETVGYDGLAAQVAALADVIRSKEAAGRERDLAALPALRATLEILEAATRDGATMGAAGIEPATSRV
jgi:hypothetical protein